MPPRSPHSIKSNGFSLTELMVSVAIIGLLVSLSVVSMRDVAGSHAMASSTYRLAGLIDSAREEAILKQQPTVVAMLRGEEESSYKSFVVLQYIPETETGGSSWKQISRWEKLVDGVVVDTQASGAHQGLSTAFTQENSPTINPALPLLDHHSNSFNPRTEYGYLVFLPDGSLFQSANSRVRLVPGIFSKSGIERTGAEENYMEIVINNATGRTRVLQPE